MLTYKIKAFTSRSEWLTSVCSLKYFSAAFSGFLFFISLILSGPANSGPRGGNIVGGSGQINQTNLTTTINQNSSSLAINWNSFDVNKNEIVNFLQPSSSSIALNRILSNSGSQIMNTIPGIHPLGHAKHVQILSSKISHRQINVGGLIASGLDISRSDFINGNYIFNEVLGTDGTVVNSGLINA